MPTAASLLRYASRQSGRIVRLATDPQYRSVLTLRFLHDRAVHQWSCATAFDRYPDVFELCARQLAGRAAPRILSFGCSTGEEVLTLRRYLPDATLIGADINRHSLRVCSRLPGRDARMRFIFADADAIRASGPYDAVFCMAVLQRRENREPGRTRAVRSYPFSRFETQIAALDAVVKPGGLFAIDNADYRFEDTRIAQQYRAIDAATRRDRPVFDPTGRRVAGEVGYHRVFERCR